MTRWQNLIATRTRSKKSEHKDIGMERSQTRHQPSQDAYHPWFKFGPFLILILFWLGSASGYIFSSFEEYVSWCIPHFEGCTSISRAGRSGTSFFIFKFTMIPAACLVFVYWLDMARWNHATTPTPHVLETVPIVLGCLGALALLGHMTFLGIDCGICRTIRSYGTSIFFLFTFVAQWLVASRIWKQSGRNWYTLFYFVLCCVLSLEIVLIITIPLFIENSSAMENAIAWRASYLISLAPAISAYSWRRTNRTL